VITSDLRPRSVGGDEAGMGARIFHRRTRGGMEGQGFGYTVRLASTREDVRAAQTLRFLVFNLEMQEGLESSYLTLRDEDRFDAACDHLLVEFGGEVVGTYRMQSGGQAAAGHGFYSAQEFDFGPFESISPELMELGRACVRRDHRNLTVLSLLWRGIAAHARAAGCRYLVGCSSLTSQSAQEGMAVYEMLAPMHLAPEPLRTRPLQGWECVAGTKAVGQVSVPKLLRAYLSLGAWICGEPALDREFKTIDFLTVMDLENLRGSAANFLG
jgi:putative hemolysin